MKFWVKAKGDGLEEQLLVSADSVEELRKQLQELLHVTIRQMSVTDFHQHVVEKLNSGIDIVAVNIRTSQTASGGGGDSLADSLRDASSSFRSANTDFLPSSVAESPAPLVRTSSGNSLTTAAMQGQGRRSSSGSTGVVGGSSSTSDLFSSEMVPPIDRICVRRDDLLTLLAPALREKFHSTVQGCFVRVRGAFSLGTTASGYAMVQIVSVNSESTIGLDLVHVVEVRSIDAVSNSPPTADEVKAWARHMIHAGRPLVTNIYIEGKQGNIAEAMNDARSLLASPPPPPPASSAPSVSAAGVAEGGASSSRASETFAPAQDSLRPPRDLTTEAWSAPTLEEPSPPPNGNGQQHISKLRRRQTILLQPNLLLGVPDAVGSGTSPMKDGSTGSGGGPGSRSGSHGNSPTVGGPSGISPTNSSAQLAVRMLQSLHAAAAAAAAAATAGTVPTATAVEGRAVSPPPPPTPSEDAAPFDRGSSFHASVAAGGAEAAVPDSVRFLVRLNDTLLSGWLAILQAEDGNPTYHLFGTRHSNPKAKRPKLSDYAACAVSLRASPPDHLIPYADRDVSVKGYVVHGVPQLFRGVFIVLASGVGDDASWLHPSGAPLDESPGVSPERHSFHHQQQQLPHPQCGRASGYEFVVLSGRDIFGLYNPPWRCVLPVPSWGVPLSIPGAASSPQLLQQTGDVLHVFYLVLMSGGDEVPADQDGRWSYGLAHAISTDSKLTNWSLLTTEGPIVSSGLCHDEFRRPLFHVCAALHGVATPNTQTLKSVDSLTLLWYVPSVVPSTTWGESSNVQHGSGDLGHYRFPQTRRASVGQGRRRSKSPTQCMSSGGVRDSSLLPDPAPPSHPATSSSFPHSSSGTNTKAREDQIVALVNLDDRYRPGSWTPHDISLPDLVPASAKVPTAAASSARGNAAVLEELRQYGGIHSVSLVHAFEKTSLLVVGEDRHKRGVALLTTAVLA